MSQVYESCAFDATDEFDGYAADEQQLMEQWQEDLDVARHEAACALRRLPSAEDRRRLLDELEQRIAAEERVGEAAGVTEELPF